MSEKKSQTKKILIVEDEVPIAQTLALKLTNSGFSVSHALNGDMALSLLDKEFFHLVLLDIIMPEKDGFVVLKNIKRS